MELETGDAVLCTVSRIEGTTVFVDIERNGEGNIVISEIAPGRIRNLREYVVPKKKIVCKVLRIKGDRIELSLRRVTPKERKEVMDEYKSERSYGSVLKSILGEKSEGVIKKIEEDERLFDFIEESKSSPKALEKLIGKEKAKKTMEIINSQKEKKIVLKKEINVRTRSPEGIGLIKNLLGGVKDVGVSYVSAGRYLLRTESNDPKKSSNKIKKAAEKMEKEAKKKGIEFGVKEK